MDCYVGSPARCIGGGEGAPDRALLGDVLERATRGAHIYLHDWESGDLVIWDNRCLLHRGTGFDADKYRRYMRQTRVQGACSTLDE